MTDSSSNVLADGELLERPASARASAVDDETLIRRCRQGDVEAFAPLVTKYRNRVLNVVYRLCGNQADAEELTQDAFCKAFEKLQLFRGGSQFYTWLFRIATNLAISHRRRAVRVKFHSLTGADDGNPGRADHLTAEAAERREPGPEATAASNETARRVHAALATLDEEFRMAVVLRDLEGMDYARVAEVMGVPVWA